MSGRPTGRYPRGAVGQGALLLPVDPWVPFELDRDLNLTHSPSELSDLFSLKLSESLLPVLDRSSRDWLSTVASELEEGTSESGYMTTCLGRPLEALLVRKGDRFEGYVRSAENRTQRMEDLAFFYRSFLTSANAVAFTDPEGTILDVNRQFLDLYGYQLSEVIGENPRVLKSGRQDPHIYEKLWSDIRNPDCGYWSGELVNRRKSGEEVIVILSISTVRNGVGAPIGYIASATDITAQRALEAELRAKNQELEALNSLKNEVLAVTSHDLKSPLAAMVSYASLILDRMGRLSPEQTERYLQEIVDSGHKLAEFIDDLLDIGKLEGGRPALEPARLRLDAVLGSCIERARAQIPDGEVGLNYRVHGVPRPTVADLVKVEQVFNNLLSNAIKFSPSGGEVDVEYRNDGDWVEVSVSDRGPGISEMELEKVFERYYQGSGARPRREVGKSTGLGLAICKGIVELHGGSIWAENRFGSGCRITFRIPIKNASGVSAVIVDPSNRIRDLLRSALESQDVEILHAARLDELHRIYEYERPNIVFLGAELDQETRRFLRNRIVGDEREPVVVQIVDGNHQSTEPWFRTLKPPILGTEIGEIFRETRMRTASLR